MNGLTRRLFGLAAAATSVGLRAATLSPVCSMVQPRRRQPGPGAGTGFGRPRRCMISGRAGGGGPAHRRIAA